MSRICEEGIIQELVDQLEQYHNHIMGGLAALLKPEVALDIGTQTGDSAYKMAQGGAQRVLTFDIVNHFWTTPGFPHQEKITFHEADLCIPEVAAQFADDIAQCTLAYIDVDPHDGLQEPLLVDALRRYQKHDIVCGFDDIELSPGMKHFWASLKDEKLSVPWGHPDAGFGIALLRRPT